MFPEFHVPYAGTGTVIGTNAVIHMVIAQGVAVGFLGVLGMTDMVAMLRGPQSRAWDSLLKSLLKFAVIVTTIGGAVTGAGIWFTIGSLVPHATASMLRVFFWPWFIEWLVFVTEVLLILVLYFSWDRLARHRKVRIALQFLYAISGFWSAFLITGILGFMLTVGDWPTHRSLAVAFFNPSFLPQLISRLSLAVLIGAVGAMAITLWNRTDRRVVEQVLPIYGVCLLVALCIFVAAATWYLGVVPNFFTTRSVYAVLTQHLARSPAVFYVANAIAGMLLALIVAAAVARSRRVVAWLVAPCLLVVVGLTAEFERVREFIRGPYLMPSHMYVSTVLLKERLLYENTGMLPHRPWYQWQRGRGEVARAGAYLFSRNCTACHTTDGINDIRVRARGRSEDGLYVLIGRTHEVASFMPPFSGNALERRMTARFLYRLKSGELRLRSHSRLVPDDGTARP